MRRLLRWLAIGAVSLLILVVLALGASLVLLRSGAGRGWVAAELERALAAPDRRVTISGLSGALPQHWRIREIAVADRAGVWLRLDDAALDLDLAALLRGRLRVEQLSAAAIEVLRAPAAAAPAKTSPGFALPGLPVALELDRLAVPRIDLGGLAGRTVVLGLDGAASLNAARGRVRLRLAQTAGGVAALDLRAAYGRPPAGGAARLDLTLRGSEPSGTLFAGLFPGHPREPLTLSLVGHGPLAGWTGWLDAAAGQEARLGAGLSIARRRDAISIAAKGTAQVAALLPAALHQPVGDAIGFDLSASLADGGKLGLDHAELTLAAVRIAGAGGYDPASGTLTGKAELSADLAGFSDAAGAPLAGRLALAAAVSGTVARPAGTLTLRGTALAYGADSAKTASARLDLAPAGGDRFRITGEGSLGGLASADRPLAAGLGDRLDWTADLTAGRQGDTVELARATLSGGGLAFDAAGTWRAGALIGHATLAAADLSRFAALAGTPLAGSLSLAAEASGPAAGPVSARLTGRFERLRLGIPVLDAALGPAGTLTAAGTRDPSGRLSLTALRLAGAQLSLDGAGQYDSGAGRLAGHAVLHVPRLAPLGAALGSRLDGALTLTAELSGASGHPAATLRLHGTGLAAGAARLDRLEARLDVPDLARRRAQLGASFGTGKLDARLAASLSQPAAQRVAIDRLALTAPGTLLDGRAMIDLRRRRAAGALAGQVVDLAAWTPLLGVPLAGEASLALRLTAAGGQGAAATLDARNLAYGADSLGRLHATARLTDLFGRPRGTLGLQAKDARLAGARLDGLRLDAASAPDGGFGFHLASTGEAAARPFKATAAGNARLDPGGQTLRLTRLDGTLAALPFRLEQPLEASRKGAALRLNGLALSIGKGRIAGDAGFDGRSIEASLKATALPLGALAALAGRSGIAGSIGLELTLAGPATSPQGRLIVSGEGLNLDAGSGTPPLALAASAELASGSVSFKGRVHGPAGTAALDFAGAVPVAFAGGLAVAVPRDRPIRGTLEGDGRLDALAGMLPIGEGRIAGRYTLSLTVAGTAAAPQAGGRLSLADGLYVDSATGLALHGLQLDLKGDQHAFTLSRLEATDGGGGRLSVGGRVELGGGQPRFDMAARLSSFTVARNDEVTAVASGTARLVGSLAAPKLDAALTIDRADVTIPAELPQSYPKLEVMRIDSRHPTPPRPAPPPPPPPMMATLDIRLHDAGRTFVRGNGLDSEWKGDLAVTGTSAAPALTGRLDAVNGSFDLLGKSFTIERGRIDFYGSSTPVFDLQAQAQSASITALAEIQGTPDRPKVTLTSTPPLPQDEVLSEVLFGTGLGQINPAQGLEIAAAAASLAGGGGPGVLDRLRNVTGLDRLSLGQAPQSQGTAAGQGGTASGTTLSGGKYVAPGVFVGVEQGLSSGSTRAEVEVNVTPRITVNAAAGAGDSGNALGVQYRLDY